MTIPPIWKGIASPQVLSIYLLALCMRTIAFGSQDTLTAIATFLLIEIICDPLSKSASSLQQLSIVVLITHSDSDSFATKTCFSLSFSSWSSRYCVTGSYAIQASECLALSISFFTTGQSLSDPRFTSTSLASSMSSGCLVGTSYT